MQIIQSPAKLMDFSVSGDDIRTTEAPFPEEDKGADSGLPPAVRKKEIAEIMN